MRRIMQRTANAVIVGLALLATQTAFAYYNPSTGRFLSRDPIGEPGFQLVQGVQRAPQVGPVSVAQQSTRWINRDSVRQSASKVKRETTAPPQRNTIQNEINSYCFVINDPQNQIDPLGLLTFKGCTADQQQKIQKQWNSFCQQTKSSTFKCCLKHFNLPQRLAAMCDRADTTIVCDPTETSSCGWTYPLGHTIHLGQLGLSEDPGCGPIGCTLLHEMTHLAGHWPETWADRVENCLQGCPPRPTH